MVPPGGEDLSSVVLRRLHDEDPDVVLAVAENDTLLHKVLLKPTAVSPEDESRTSPSSMAAVGIACAAVAAAEPWLSVLSKARPKHPAAASGRALCGLIGLASKAVAAAAVLETSSREDKDTAAKRAVNAAMPLFLECLPGPHTIARVKAAKEDACLASSEDKEGAPASPERACRKALRAVARAAIGAVAALDDGAFAGLGEVLDKKNDEDRSKDVNSAKKRSKKKSADVMELELDMAAVPEKPKGLKAMAEDVCQVLGVAFADGKETRMLQVKLPGVKWVREFRG